MKHVIQLKSPYRDISLKEYHSEKPRLQIELLKIQERVVKEGLRVAVCFDGRDAAGKGSTIKRFVEHLMPKYYRTIELGTPTAHESKHWFQRYSSHLPKKQEMVFFDRSWYNRALIEPTMGYCTKGQYMRFMHKVLDWEHRLIANGLILFKFYLSVSPDNQLLRFHQRMTDPLKYWKLSPNDLKARKKWETFTNYKKQMLARTSSKKSPWILINSNRKMQARLTAMLHVVHTLGNKDFKPRTKRVSSGTYNLKIKGVEFDSLNAKQYAVLTEMMTNNRENMPEQLDIKRAR